MKKLFIILAILAFSPIAVHATTISTSFDDTQCQLHVTGTLDSGHQAQVVYYINDQFEGEGNNTIVNNQYEVVLTLAYDTDTTLKIRVADENGANEEVKNNVVVPACTPPAPSRVNEVFDNQGNSIIINDANVGFDSNDYLDLGIRSKEEIEQYLETLKTQNDPDYDTYNGLYKKMKQTVGDGNELIYYIESAVRDEHDSVIDYSNYNEGFVLNILFPKSEYKKLKGLKLMSVDDATFDKITDINYTYDETNEVFVIHIDRPGVILAYLDRTVTDTASNPNTGDIINRYIILLIISTLGLIVTGIYTKKKIFN